MLDPRVQLLRTRASVVLSKYFVQTLHDMYLTCEGVPRGATLTPHDLGTARADCTGKMSAQDVVKVVGAFPMPLESVAHVARGYAHEGVCTKPVRDSYGEWLLAVSGGGFGRGGGGA